jgi:hypothetical protein
MLTRARSALGASLVLALALGVASSAAATTLTISTLATETLAGVNFTNQHVMVYDTVAALAPTQFFDGAGIAVNTNIDALHVLPNGDLVFSTASDSSIGALNFLDGDLVQVNPLNLASAAVIFSESFITGTNVDIDALWIDANGDYVISTTLGASIGPTAFDDGDLLRFTPGNPNSASIIFDDALFTSAALNNTNGVHILPSGSIIMTVASAFTLGGSSFQAGDVIRYNPGANFAQLVFDDNDPNWAIGTGQVDAVYVPEPSSAVLLALGALGMVGIRRRRS